LGAPERAVIGRASKARTAAVGGIFGMVKHLPAETSGQLPDLGGCGAWGAESENRPQRGQFLPDLPAHSPAMGQEDGEKLTAAADLQPTIPKSDTLLG
jgi:hypothetical protein